jgi:cellulose synthase/poly-beta-1,6-N-acetylglucosamine synthase-like glycosyltransferase
VTILFVACILVFLHAYVFYPLSLWLFVRVAGDRARHLTSDVLPRVSLVVSAYNEERCIRQKIENSLALDYPPDRVHVIVVSDGSSDRTVEMSRAYAGKDIDVRAFSGRRGKVACLNEVIPTLATDLVVMSDANSMYDPESLRLLVRHFADEEIGCVCGRLHYENPWDEQAGDTEKAYWGYEGWLKGLESRLGSLLGANGSIYAYRHELFRPVDPLTFCDDVIPIRIALTGRKVIYDPEAWCCEETSNERVEMRRRKRHASFGLRSMIQMMREAVGARKPLILYQCISHRVLRWLGGPALVGMLVSTAFVPHPLRVAAVAVQGPVYLLAVLGWALTRAGLRFRPAYVAYYGIAIHAAGLAGLANFILGRDRPFWEPRQ